MKVAAIVGPTAVGKTELSLRVAERLAAEIVSVDSMQLYKGMDVGTAKPSREERDRVPHHLLDLYDPTREVTVAEVQELARAAIKDITERGKLPLLVGGSGLYFRAVVDDLNIPPRSEEVRAALEAKVEEYGPESLHQRLWQRDPDAARRIEPGNARRIVRALEVIELTGRPFSENDAWERYESIYDLRVIGLTRPREDLYDRITRRVNDMLRDGLLTEAQVLMREGAGRTARQALGYRQILEAPKRAALKDVTEEIVRATKRFARRQESWFKADPRVAWVQADRPGVLAQVLGDLSHWRQEASKPGRTS
jgi:tRNA dimethylallyltransferase